MKLLEGKVALVTGAARGIGKAIALRFAEQGANIAFTDLAEGEEKPLRIVRTNETMKNDNKYMFTVQAPSRIRIPVSQLLLRILQRLPLIPHRLQCVRSTTTGLRCLQLLLQPYPNVRCCSVRQKQ